MVVTWNPTLCYFHVQLASEHGALAWCLILVLSFALKPLKLEPARVPWPFTETLQKMYIERYWVLKPHWLNPLGFDPQNHFPDSSTTKTTAPPSYTSTNQQARHQKITQLVSAKTPTTTITQTIQITSNLHYTSTHRTSTSPPTTATRSKTTKSGTHITGHILRYSTTSPLAALQTNHHLEAQSPQFTFNTTFNATTTLSSSTGTIHHSPSTTRHPQQPNASIVPTTSPEHTTAVQPNINTTHTTFRLPANGFSHWPHADTPLSTHSALNSRRYINTTPTTRHPPFHEHPQLQTTPRNTHHSPTASQLACTTLATLPKPYHPSSHHPPIPTSPWRSPPTQPRNAPRQRTTIFGTSNGDYGISLQLHQIHLPPHLPEQEHLESGTHKTTGVITAPIHAPRGLQICTRNISERDHWVLIHNHIHLQQNITAPIWQLTLQHHQPHPEQQNPLQHHAGPKHQNQGVTHQTQTTPLVITHWQRRRQDHRRTSLNPGQSHIQPPNQLPLRHQNPHHRKALWAPSQLPGHLKKTRPLSAWRATPGRAPAGHQSVQECAERRQSARPDGNCSACNRQPLRRLRRRRLLHLRLRILDLRGLPHLIHKTIDYCDVQTILISIS